MLVDDPGFYDLLVCASRNGTLDRLLAVTGMALEGALACTGRSVADLFTAAEEASPSAIGAFDETLAGVRPLLGLAADEELMKRVALLLEHPLVAQLLAASLQGILVGALTAPAAKTTEVKQ